MKKLLLLSILLIVGCSHVVKSIWGTPIGVIKYEGITESACEVECKVFEYDDNFIELLNGYEHPWCICMTQCYVGGDGMVSDSSYCSATNNNPLNSLKNKIKYNNSIKSDSTKTN